MLLIDVFIRYSTITLLLLLGLLAYRDRKNSTPALYVVLVTISVAALMIITAPGELKPPRTPYIIIHLIDVPNIAFIWWLGLSMFEDDFRLNKWHWAMFILYTGLIFIYRLLEYGAIAHVSPVFNLFVDIVTFAMMAHLFLVAIKGRADDLIEPRRRFRLFFVLALVIGTALTVLAENIFMPEFTDEVALFRAAIALPLTLCGILWLVTFHPEKLSFQTEDIPIPKKTGLDPRDKSLHDRLVQEMDEGKIYLEPDITIRTLAARLKTPEHRLRVLINQGMGYRNFSSFLNTYRIKAVKDAFSAPENTRIPVLTIAMDAGYGSLAPFNRAFLKAEGMTPSAYRHNLLVKPDHN
ncbi:MAG: AraC family transcriptional regulator [Robiginitomaculum sp.]|nr:AraC family transcriptional regulator [Robiginitomaculum sp.]